MNVLTPFRDGGSPIGCNSASVSCHSEAKVLTYWGSAGKRVFGAIAAFSAPPSCPSRYQDWTKLDSVKRAMQGQAAPPDGAAASR